MAFFFQTVYSSLIMRSADSIATALLRFVFFFFFPFAFAPNRDKVGKGQARSVSGFHVNKRALSPCDFNPVRCVSRACGAHMGLLGVFLSALGPPATPAAEALTGNLICCGISLVLRPEAWRCPLCVVQQWLHAADWCVCSYCVSA